MVPMEVFPPFIAQCPENNGCSVHVDGKGDSTGCRSGASSACGLAQVAGPLSALVLIIQKKSLDQTIPQALAVLISCAVMLYQVLTKVQKPPLGCRSFPQHREASLHLGGTYFLREQLPSGR